MTLDFDEEYLANYLDSIKNLAEENKSKYNTYPQLYANLVKAYSIIGLYVTYQKGHHIIKRNIDL